jgi:hypothetical protein
VNRELETQSPSLNRRFPEWCGFLAERFGWAPTNIIRRSGPRKGFIYFSDDGDLVGVRFDNWKVVFMEQRMAGTMGVWAEPFVALRLPKLFNLRTDPFERADVTSNTYWDWVFHKGYFVLAATAVVQPFLESFKEFPPRQKAASFTLEQALQKMESVGSGAGH